MPETKLIPCGYHVIRYTPNLVRDEWVNIGVILFEVESGRVLFRFPDQDGDWLRVRRLHPQADETLLRRLPEEFEARLAGPKGSAESPLGNFRRWSETLGDTVQLSPQKGLLAEDLDAELNRLYRDQVEPVRATRRLEDLSNRNAIRTRADQVFRSFGLLPRLERRVRVDDFTFTGDPLRLDYAYRRNGTRGFVQALPLGRDPGQAKVLAFTADAIRAKLAKSEFLAVSETEPRPQENARHKFVTGLLEEHDIPVIPLTRLGDWAQRMRPQLLGANGH